MWPLQDHFAQRIDLSGAHQEFNGQRLFDIAQVTYDMKMTIQVGLANVPHGITTGSDTLANADTFIAPRCVLDGLAGCRCMFAYTDAWEDDLLQSPCGCAWEDGHAQSLSLCS